MSDVSGEKSVEKSNDAAQRVTKAEVTSHPRRKYRTYLLRVALAAIAGAFTTLTILVKSTPSFPIDLEITRALQSIHSPLFAALMTMISWPGFAPQTIIIPVLIALVLYLFGFYWEAVTSLVAAFLPLLVNIIVKEYIQRPRPTIDLVNVFSVLNSYSFPSGHVMFYVGFFGFMWFLIYTLMKRSWRRTTLLIFLGIMIALVGFSRVYLGQHWPSDVLGAYLLGSLTLVIIILFYRWGKKRYFVRQPVAPEKPKSTEQ